MHPPTQQSSGGDIKIPVPRNTHNEKSGKMPMIANQNDFEYHTDDDDVAAQVDNEVMVVRGDDIGADDANSNPMMMMMMMDKEDQTIDTERALHGTPVKKKKKDLLVSNHNQYHRHQEQLDPTLLPPAMPKGSKKHHKGGRKKSKVIIDNVDEFANHQQQHHLHQLLNHHYSEGSRDVVVVGDDEGIDVGVGEEIQEPLENKSAPPAPTNTTTFDAGGILDIAAHARKLASDGILLDNVTESNAAAAAAAGNHDDSDDDIDTRRHYINPRRIGKSKSHDSQDSNPGNNSSNNHHLRNDHANANTIHSVSRKLRDDNDDNNGGKGSSIYTRREREQFVRASKSWDDDGGASEQRWSIGSGSVETFARGGGNRGDASFSGVNGFGGLRVGDSRTTTNNVWDNNFDFNSNFDKKSTSTSGGTSRRRRGSFLRESKSWDDDGTSDHRKIGSDEGIARWGTWGEDHASLFVGSSTGAADTGDRLGGVGGGKDAGERPITSSDTDNLTDRERNSENSLSANFNTLEEWDKAEAQWRETISAVGGRGGTAMPSLVPQSSEQKIDRSSPRKNTSKKNPWSSDEQSMVFEGLDSRSSISHDLGDQSVGVGNSNSVLSTEEGDDDDSIFAFGKMDHAQSKKVQELPVTAEPTQAEQHQLDSPPSAHNPADIFYKIKSGLKQADKTKNRARGIQGNESDSSNDQSDMNNNARDTEEENALARAVKSSLVSESSTVQTSSSFHDEMSKKDDKRSQRIKFATDSQNTVHTYWAESEEDLSEIDKFDDINEEDRDRPSVGNKKTIQSTSIRSGKVAESKKTMPFRQPENDQEGSDNDTYGDSTIEDSITYKSGQSDDLRKEELDNLDLTILDHVDNAVSAVAATLGGLFGVGVGLAQKQPAQSDIHTDSGASGADNRMSRVTEDDTTTYDTDTYGESTAFTTLNTGTRTDGSEYDWIDYMRSYIFPKDVDVSKFHCYCIKFHTRAVLDLTHILLVCRAILRW